MKVSSRGVLLSLAIMASLVLIFQNCGPAKLSGGTDGSSSVQYASADPGYAVGMKVDLNNLLTATPEDANNIVFPTKASPSIAEYSLNSPIIENLILKKNDFTSIIWVHGPSSTVMNLGDSFNGKSFSTNLEGTYYVLGFRGATPFLITQLVMTTKATSSIGLNTGGAVQITQTIVDSSSDTESILINVQAPIVDLNTIKFTILSTGEVFNNKRALLITKKLTERIDLSIELSDLLGQSLTQSITLAIEAVTATPTPNPTPSMTPAGATPTPTPASTPSPTPVPTSTPSPTSIPGLSISPSSLNFGNQAISTSSAVQFIKFINGGTSSITFNSNFLTRIYYKFTTTGTCSGTLDPGASCTYGVQFTPMFTGSVSAEATFLINLNTNGGTVNIPIDGAGI